LCCIEVSVELDTCSGQQKTALITAKSISAAAAFVVAVVSFNRFLRFVYYNRFVFSLLWSSLAHFILFYFISFHFISCYFIIFCWFSCWCVIVFCSCRWCCCFCGGCYGDRSWWSLSKTSLSYWCSMCAQGWRRRLLLFVFTWLQRRTVWRRCVNSTPHNAPLDTWWNGCYIKYAHPHPVFSLMMNASMYPATDQCYFSSLIFYSRCESFLF